MHLPRPLVVATSGPVYRLGLYRRVPVRWQRRILGSPAAMMRLPADTRVEHTTLGNRPAERVIVGASERPRAILFLHGGGYTVGSPRLYRACAAVLARASNSVVYCLDYRLAPEHPFPAALDDAVAAFRELITVQGLDPSRVAIAGDSAGGGLSVAAARVLTDAGLAPAALGLISPWTDPSDEEFTRQRDFVVNLRGGRLSASHYRGSVDARDPGYAPIHGRLDGLPPTLIHCSPNEMLYPQIVRFAGLLEGAGVQVTLVAQERWWHSVHVLAGMLREATDAVRDLGAFLRAHLDAAPARESAG
ncbi:MAG: alpha/beta hydrolase [Actinomycetota bacterium]|nr:alpha/beta hydrolase [Actinomycetota bacterium]